MMRTVLCHMMIVVQFDVNFAQPSRYRDITLDLVNHETEQNLNTTLSKINAGTVSPLAPHNVMVFVPVVLSEKSQFPYT